MNTLLKYRIVLSGFMLGVALSGATAFPLTWELGLLYGWLEPHRATFPALFEWMARVREGLVQSDALYPFLAYGTDWLAFAHLVIAGAYVGPWREPVRNRFVLEWGMFCCFAVIPLAFVCGPVRGIPLGWTLVDCAFGVVGFPPLFWCWKWSQELEKERRSAT